MSVTKPTEVCTCSGRGDLLCVGCYNRTRRQADPCYELRQERDQYKTDAYELAARLAAALVNRPGPMPKILDRYKAS